MHVCLPFVISCWLWVFTDNLELHVDVLQEPCAYVTKALSLFWLNIWVCMKYTPDCVFSQVASANCTTEHLRWISFWMYRPHREPQTISEILFTVNILIYMYIFCMSQPAQNSISMHSKHKESGVLPADAAVRVVWCQLLALLWKVNDCSLPVPIPLWFSPLLYLCQPPLYPRLSPSLALSLMHTSQCQQGAYWVCVGSSQS